MDDERPNSGPHNGPDGKFLPGNNANPLGAYTQKGLQPYGKRAAYWLDKLSIADLERIASDKAELRKYSAYDGIIIIHLARTVASKDIGRERDRLLDRIEGYPIQTVREAEKLKPTMSDVDAVSDDEALAEYERLTKN